MRIKEFFTDKELGCKCGCGLLPSQRSVNRLYALRLLWGKPIPASSAARCVGDHIRIYNRQGKYGEDIPMGSRHLPQENAFPDAFDCQIAKGDIKKFIKLAKMCGFTGIGVYSWGVHLDTRPKEARWG
ncbi:MAG: hypothetical protein GY938_07665 [Ketobacter sp.]|nr:hypothetical protein [Ketobacter sp.]